jgi:hypothetical protein
MQRCIHTRSLTRLVCRTSHVHQPQDPLAIIGVTAILFPFVLLGIAVATGLVDLSVYR